MRVEIIDVNTENKGKYRVANVAYKNLDGQDPSKPEGKKIMSFTNKDVFKIVSESKQGDVLDVKSAKNDKGYWEWTEVGPQGKNAGVQETNKKYSEAAKGGRDFETTEERAKKQVYIVRQSSITAALDLVKINGTKAPVTEADVIKSAKEFEKFVFALGKVVPDEAEVS